MNEMTGIMSGTFSEETKNFLNLAKSLLTWKNLFHIVFALIFILVLWIVYKLALRGIKKIPAEKTNPHRTMILNRIVKYSFYVILIVEVLSLFGVKLSAIWGAAGIAGIAIGFAAQTSVSNLISGLFVLSEGTIKVGDFIAVGDVMGTVDLVTLLSIRIHTPDNQMVRIPNSTVINSNLTNYSFNGNRRFTFKVDISYDTDMEKALEALKKTPSYCTTILSDPEPKFWFDGFGDSGISMTAAVWFEGKNLIPAKNEMFIAIKKAFDEAGIEIPYTKIDVNLSK